MKLILKYLNRYKGLVLLNIIGVLGFALVELGIPTIMATVIDKGIAYNDISYIKRMGIVIVAISILGVMGSILLGYTSANISTKVVRDIRNDIFKKAQELGFNFICLTGNPGVGVSNHSIAAAIKEAKKYFKGLIIAGKMHGAGVNEPVVDLEAIKEFIDAGADVILMPAVNTVPGLSEATVTKACEYIHAHNALALSAIGTSQEGADTETVREIAIVNKRCGVDIQHIGDAGWCGMALPENIMTLSVAIRGKRWTYHKIASSVNR